MRTFVQSVKNISKSWILLDAEGVVLGKVASLAAAILRGKHKPTYSPNLDDGDCVVIINAEKVRLSGDKLASKFHYWHSNHMGGIKKISYGELLEKKPAFVLERAVKGMLPKNRLGRAQYGNLHVFSGPNHKHQAQSPQKLDIK